MNRSREQTWCCGAGGGVAVAFPELARWAAAERLKEVKATESSTVVTACPWCEYIFGQISENGIKIRNIAQLFLESRKGI